ncbi:hypothetical protein BH10PAT1_BH10PAT1_0290 [soil metagenome]
MIENILRRLPISEVYKFERRSKIMHAHDELKLEDPQKWADENALGMAFIMAHRSFLYRYPTEYDPEEIKRGIKTFISITGANCKSQELVCFALTGSAIELNDLVKKQQPVKFYNLRNAHQALSEYFETI